MTKKCSKTNWGDAILAKGIQVTLLSLTHFTSLETNMEIKHITPLVIDDDLDEKSWHIYQNSRTLAVDTETMGLRTQRDRLCVVQLCNEQGYVTLIRVRSRSAPRLQHILESPAVEKVFHFARFDLAALRYWLNIRVQPFFCTKIASRLCRTYTDQHSLKTLTRELLAIELDKQEQTSDWGADILTPNQIQYAANDVIHLIPIKEHLTQLLTREKRLSLALATMEFLHTRVELDLEGFEAVDIFSHM